METSPATRALAALVHGSEDIFEPAVRAALCAQPQSAEILALARAFHAAPAESPSWAATAHRCATAAVAAEHTLAPLEAITSRVQLGDAPHAPAYLHPRDLPHPGAGMEDLLPVLDARRVTPLIDGQRAALGAALADILLRLPTLPLPTAVIQALAALRRYAWALSAHSPECAWYEHARVCAAAAACLSDQPAPHALTLLVGDLSGIQTFIFGTTQSAAGGAARRLRARSMSLSLLGEVVGHRLLASFELPLTNLLVATAGHLYVLLPSGNETETRLAAVRREIECWLRDTYSGELGLHLAWRTVEPSDLLPSSPGRRGCGALLRELAADLARAKLRPLAAALQPGGVWDEGAFVLAADDGGGDVCAACRHLPARHLIDTDTLCDVCATDYHVGRLLPDATALAFYDDGTPGDLALLPPYTVRLLRPDERITGAPYLVAPLNAGTGAFPEDAPALPRHTITRVPRGGSGQPLDFDTLAGKADGAPYLGVLRADVDRLGAVFAWGLRRDTDGCDGLAEALTLSRTLDTFVTGWAQHLLMTDYGTLYPIFGGGDDLILVGPWDRILAATARLRADFGRYTANPQITLSAGVAVVAARLPVSRAAEQAGDAERLAKDGTVALDGRIVRAGRDSVAVFGAQLSWNDLPTVRRAVDTLTAPGAGVGGAFLHRLLYYGKLRRRYGQGDLNALRYKMWLAYDVGRNIRDARVSPDVARWCTGLVEATLTGAEPADLAHLEVVARWAILATRKGEEGSAD